VSWFFAEWNNPAIGSAAAFSFGLVTYALAPPIVAHAVLVYAPGRPLSLGGRLALSIAYVGAGLVLGLLPALFFDPFGQGCNLCPANLFLVHASQGWFSALSRSGVRLGAVWSVGLAALMIWAFVRSSSPLRRATGFVLLAGSVYLCLVAADFVHSVRRGFLSNDPVDERLWFGQAVALCGLGAGVAWSWVLRRRTRSAIARLMVELSQSPPPGGLRDVLASALGDADLAVAYPLSDGRYVDAQGRTVDLTPQDDRSVTPLVRNRTTVALLRHPQGLLDDPGLVEEVAAAARLALDNERLESEVRAQIADLRASRARIVATGDAERRRLERDLHDGAQQRLIGLVLALHLARARLAGDLDPELLARLEAAEQEVHGSIEDLRTLAHGIYPAVLGDQGLAAAVDALVLTSPVAITVTAVPNERFPSQVEMAAYALLLHAAGPIASSVGASGATVEITHDGDQLRVEVAEDRADGEPGWQLSPELRNRLAEVADRVGALGGQLRIEHATGHAVTIRAEIPCAWS
jgi:signal transduction histidine kinase